jgi:hypothetical protein
MMRNSKSPDQLPRELRLLIEAIIETARRMVDAADECSRPTDDATSKGEV